MERKWFAGKNVSSTVLNGAEEYTSFCCIAHALKSKQFHF